jgi:hypothetical protein
LVFKRARSVKKTSLSYDKKPRTDNKTRLLVITAVLLPFLCIFVWQQHVKLVFPNPRQYAHVVSVDNYSRVYNSKTPEDIDLETDLFLERLHDLKNNAPIRNFLIFNIGVLVIYAVFRLQKQKENELLSALLFVDIICALYLVGMYYMYIFSMPTSEAAILAGYNRYLDMGTKYLEGYLVIQLALLINKAENIKRTVLSSVGTLLILGTIILQRDTFQSFKIVFSAPEYNGTLRQRVESAFESYNPALTYVVYSAPTEVDPPGYAGQIMKYSFDIANPLNYGIVDNNFLYALTQANYLIIIEEDEAIKNFMSSQIGPRDSYVGSFAISARTE